MLPRILKLRDMTRLGLDSARIPIETIVRVRTLRPGPPARGEVVGGSPGKVPKVSAQAPIGAHPDTGQEGLLRYTDPEVPTVLNTVLLALAMILSLPSPRDPTPAMVSPAPRPQESTTGESKGCAQEHGDSSDAAENEAKAAPLAAGESRGDPTKPHQATDGESTGIQQRIFAVAAVQAWAAVAMALIALVTCGVVIIYTRQTINQTEVLAAQTRILLQQTEILMQELELTNRAWVSVENIGPELPSGEFPTFFSWTLQNTGRVPAKGQLQVRLFTAEPETTPKWEDNFDAAGVKSITGEFVVLPGGTATAESGTLERDSQWAQLQSESKCLWQMVQLTYRDIFDAERLFRTTYRVTVDPDGRVRYPQGPSDLTSFT